MRFMFRVLTTPCTVNDAFVMKAWAESTGADKADITVVADPQAELAKALKTDFELAALGGVRSKRFAAFVDDGIIKHMVVDPGDDSSFAPAMLKVVSQD